MTSMKKGRLSVAKGFGFLFFLFFLQISSSLAQQPTSLTQLKESFAHPPDDSRIMVRWWWFGPAVTKPEIQKELEQMKAAGIGGVEIATLYPLALDDPQTGFRNLAVSFGRIHRRSAFRRLRSRKAGDTD